MTEPRPRPELHFTAQRGWINDPYGISWDGAQYHLFYQAIPDSLEWRPECRWGHATSPDLVQWTEGVPALVPQPFEVGCWSGSVLPEERVLFYTRVNEPVWDLGAVAIARGDSTLTTWQTGVDDVVIAGPPADADVLAFRDPYVFRHGDEWVMVVGAGLVDGAGAALQYRSTDLTTWTYDGLLAHGSGDLWTGRIWECPQLFPLGDRWVLIVSVCDAGLHDVAAAVGSYDGRRFVPDSWQQLTHGTCAYAMAAFLDRDGRRCVLSWLREASSAGDWAGAHSVPAVVSLDEDGRVVLAPHPNLQEYVRTTEDGDVIEDAGIVEVFGAAGYRAYRTD